MAPLMLHFAIVLLACTGIVTAAPHPAATTTLPPKGAATIGAVKVDNPDVDSEGNGCRAGSVGAAFTTDNTALTLIFDNFQAAVGPSAGTLKKRAFCRVNVTLASPGWAFEVSSVDFRSYVNIAKGVDVSLVSRWKWIDSKGVDMKGKVGQRQPSVPAMGVFTRVGKCEEGSKRAFSRRLPSAQGRRSVR
ncbi:uncharacterized protein CC84DRAFT_305614 [Paraphaeosphaeria sporulosa]|uniref:Ecp2 effector protein domain-containing protein n=1 Tax=Paraphaeosphaeria sporulosa TaxID=1460663 RepID=A0A177BZS8_9PLEO|nr:uncharacterized protein CC84DRAFT_305614 [Paraphaeosphaeria sporulosa]OAG00491.1 hypothetical protein CC84DRAFT_305614 [Paraphaeosphaeria sporulosa]